jgi:hypothetical protein
MGQKKTQTEKRAIEIVDGYITVEIVHRKKQPRDKGKVSNFLRTLKEKRKQNVRMERRDPVDYGEEAG